MQKFLILCTARTGSNYLINLLSVHKDLKIFGELFNFDKLKQSDLDVALSDPLSYFKNKFYQEFPSSIKSVGFKLFYDHLSEDYFWKPVKLEESCLEVKNRISNFNNYVGTNFDRNELLKKFEQVKDFIVLDKEIKIIHLKRENLLRTYISSKRTFLTDEWLKINDKPKFDNVSFRIDPDECKDFFNKIDKNENYHDQLFKEHDILEITYEDLNENRNTTIQQVIQFLNLSNYEPKSILRKQVTVPLSAIVTNYFELKSNFKDSKWNYFFEE